MKIIRWIRNDYVKVTNEWRRILHYKGPQIWLALSYAILAPITIVLTPIIIIVCLIEIAFQSR